MTVCSTAVLHLLSVDPAHAAESNRNYWACAQWGSPCSTIFSEFCGPPNQRGDNHPETGGTIGILSVDRPHTLAVVKLLRGVFAYLFVEIVTVLDSKTSTHKAPSRNFAERMPDSARIVVYGI